MGESVRIGGVHRRELLSQLAVPFSDEWLSVVFMHACIHGMLYVQMLQAMDGEIRVIVDQLPGFITRDDCDVAMIDEEMLDD